MRIESPGVGAYRPLALKQGVTGHCCGEDSSRVEVPCEVSSISIPSDQSAARRQELGQQLWDRYLDGTLDLLPVQVSGRNDGADARSNIADTALGKEAKRSSYENAPGGRVALSFSLLEGMSELCEDFTFRVTALAGGSHSRNSRHYLGVSLDVDRIDGRQVDRNHPRFREFMNRARAMGATEVLGPGSSGHDRHIHIAWPRDARRVEV